MNEQEINDVADELAEFYPLDDYGYVIDAVEDILHSTRKFPEDATDTDRIAALRRVMVLRQQAEEEE